MTKDDIIPEELKLEGKSNFHLWKYVFTRATKREKLFHLLEDASSSGTSGKGNEPMEGKPDTERDLEDKERLLYMLTASMKKDILVKVTTHEDPKLMRRDLKSRY